MSPSQEEMITCCRAIEHDSGLTTTHHCTAPPVITSILSPGIHSLLFVSVSRRLPEDRQEKKQ